MTGVLALQPPQGADWLIILLVAVLLFGAKKLPDLASSMGKSITNFKKGMKEAEDDTAAPDATASEDEVPPATQTSRNHG
ncbi:MAG: twin-arginine translocase TatA/TatE family subunit [Nitriliruptorales bacterium]|nr:twin-arginine translocase TatA/TatE family subunit [Nitriliruptorales bacterium]